MQRGYETYILPIHINGGIRAVSKGHMENCSVLEETFEGKQGS